ncbi:NU4LM oxidoreductase, partial [Acromyrmex insinuator]
FRYYIIAYIQVFLISLLLLVLIYKHIIIILIIIELLIVNMSICIYIVIVQVEIEFYLIYYLIFMVCERILGLGLLVIIVRFRGKDLYYTFNFIKF